MKIVLQMIFIKPLYFGNRFYFEILTVMPIFYFEMVPAGFVE